MVHANNNDVYHNPISETWWHIIYIKNDRWTIFASFELSENARILHLVQGNFIYYSLALIYFSNIKKNLTD